MKVLVAGDYACRFRIDDTMTEEQYSELFDGISVYVKHADISIVNYENPVLSGSKNYVPINKQGPHLKSSPKAVQAIADAGFNVVTLANNHIMDYGKEGCLNTIEVMKRYKIDTVGAGEDIKEARKTLYKQSQGKTLALINCCEHEFSIADECSAGANPMNPIHQYYAITKAKKQADFVLVIVHGGHEYYQLPSPRMQETYRFFIDAGADAVINHHQHCFSGYEYYHDKPIIYGLGNFCFDGRFRNGIWNEGYIVDLDFSDITVGMSLIPYSQCNEKPGVFPLQDRCLFDEKLKNLNTVIADPIALKKACENYYVSQSPQLEMVFEPYSNKYLRKLKTLGIIPSFVGIHKWFALLNLIDCEAHRDKLLFLLRKKCQG